MAFIQRLFPTLATIQLRLSSRQFCRKPDRLPRQAQDKQSKTLENGVSAGECGAPSTWERGGAMAHPLGFNWTETRQVRDVRSNYQLTHSLPIKLSPKRGSSPCMQAKWNLRSMIGDAATPLVRYSSVFSAMDVCYDAGPRNNIGNYGSAKLLI